MQKLSKFKNPKKDEKINTFIALVAMDTLTLFSACSQNDEPSRIAEVNTETFQENELGDILVNTIENSSREENDYIIYDAETKEYFTLNETTYLLANTFADKVTDDTDTPTRAL